MTFPERLERVFAKTVPKLAPEVGSQLAAIVTPQSLAIIAGVLVAWVVSHAFGIGEAVDVILGVVGALSIGLAVFSGIDHVFQFASGAYNGGSDHDFEVAADHLAKAIAILGIQAVLALLFRGRPQSGRIPVGPPPPRTPGIRYAPGIVEDAAAPAGTGGTSFWGNVRLSTRGTKTDRELVRLHERVHQVLAPKLYPLRNFRVENRAGSYFKSSLWRYCEEMLAETVARVGVNGLRQTFLGVKFPVANGYVYLTRGGGYDVLMHGKGLVPEGAALLGIGTVAGMAFKLYFKAGAVAGSQPAGPAPAPRR